MKKLILTIGAVAVAGAVFAQGNVNWSGPSFSFVTAQTNAGTYSSFFIGGSTARTGTTSGTVTSAATSPTAYYFELLVGSVYTGTVNTPTTLSSLASWTDTGLQMTNGMVSGRLSCINPNTDLTVGAMSSSVSNQIILVGWSANLGTTWSAALAKLQADSGWTGDAFFGASSVGYIQASPTSQTGNAVSIFGSAAGGSGMPIYSLNTQLYLVSTVPEPGTLALAALGGASLLLFRRKK